MRILIFFLPNSFSWFCPFCPFADWELHTHPDRATSSHPLHSQLFPTCSVFLPWFLLFLLFLLFLEYFKEAQEGSKHCRLFTAQQLSKYYLIHLEELPNVLMHKQALGSFKVAIQRRKAIREMVFYWILFESLPCFSQKSNGAYRGTRRCHSG